jgi:effector-binding domain-containing protein/uncharacterized protein YndB with AHSA1/START domain
VERTITIKASVEKVYAELVKLENFNRWSVWNKRDSTVQLMVSGKDGTTGAYTSWKGDPEISGEGKISIAELIPNQKIVHQLIFTSPKQGEAESEFKLENINGNTKLTWEFDLATPRPKNIFNLFYSLDKQMGKDFEEGLANFKSGFENNNPGETVKKYIVKPINFPATTYAVVRQKVKWADISSFYTQSLPVIYQEIQRMKATGSGAPSGLYYEWDNANQQTDMAAAIPVTTGTKLNDPMLQVVDISGSKALYVDYYGPYDKMEPAYNSIQKYIAENKLKEKRPYIEQYITDPATQKDTSKWLTRIIYLVE